MDTLLIVIVLFIYFYFFGGEFSYLLLNALYAEKCASRSRQHI